MADFLKALPKILRHEGVDLDATGQPVPGRTGHVKNPDDPGGETNFGIVEAEARMNGYLGPMRDIPFDLVCTIYRRKYWDKLRADDIPDQQLAEELFDTGVNCGVATVVRFLQRTLNGLNRKATLYADVPVDGMMGAWTVGVLRKALAVAPWYRLVILKALDCLQGARYVELCERNSKFETFLAGWLRNRVGLPADAIE